MKFGWDGVTTQRVTAFIPAAPERKCTAGRQERGPLNRAKLLALQCLHLLIYKVGASLARSPEERLRKHLSLCRQALAFPTPCPQMQLFLPGLGEDPAHRPWALLSGGTASQARPTPPAAHRKRSLSALSCPLQHTQASGWAQAAASADPGQGEGQSLSGAGPSLKQMLRIGHTRRQTHGPRTFLLGKWR